MKLFCSLDEVARLREVFSLIEDKNPLVHVVTITQMEVYLKSSDYLMETQKILLITVDKIDAAVDDWWNDFDAQIFENSKDGQNLLKNVLSCEFFLSWNDLISRDWIKSLTVNPRNLSIDDFRIAENQKQHLKKCNICVDKMYDCLDFRANFYWEMHCLEVEVLTAWLGSDSLPEKMVRHVSGCAMCKETTKRATWLMEGAGLLTSEAVDSKLEAFGIEV